MSFRFLLIYLFMGLQPCLAAIGQVEQVASGVWRIRFGQPETYTPNQFREKEICKESLSSLPSPSELPFNLNEIQCQVKPARTVVYIPCNEPDDQIYGFGLDSGAFEQKGLRKYLTVSAQSIERTGSSHGPVPFYVSTKGYGVYVDTARVPFVHVARLSPVGAAIKSQTNEDGLGRALKTSVEELYAARSAVGRTEVVFDLPGSSGVDVYIFAGPGIKEAVQRYNLFSGGGVVPPLWGLGLKYRNYTGGDKDSVMDVAKSFRKFGIPCDMIGLEPGWQTAAYSCSLKWSDDRFADHDAFVKELISSGYRVNLWEHAYIHPSSPIFDQLIDKCGDFLVWGGLVIDFANPEAFNIFSDYHGKTFIDHGISGFKADECDREFIDNATPFNYPYCSTFSSGIDGDQMTQMYGYLYQRSILRAFKERNLRTWSDVRATCGLASPMPFVLYSDSYGFDEYLRQLVNASFTGLLWSPEVREAGSLDELLNRVAMSSFAHQMCLNPWYVPNPLWTQYDRGKNERGELLSETEQKEVAEAFTKIINRRMSLIPYLYAAFYEYYLHGLPPLRALVIDFPDDMNLRKADDAFMFGDSLLVAPLKGREKQRTVYLPAGYRWYDLNAEIWLEGGKEIQVILEPGNVPLFVKENSIVPFARPVEYVADNTVFDLTVKVFGDTPEAFTLYADDGVTWNYEKGQYSQIKLSYKDGKGIVQDKGVYKKKRYEIISWERK